VLARRPHFAGCCAHRLLPAPGAAAPLLTRRGRRPAQGLLPPASGCRVPESGMVHHKAFQGALAASEELCESLETEHHVVGDFIALFYSPDVRPAAPQPRSRPCPTGGLL
jgi:hypothetical protein